MAVSLLRRTARGQKLSGLKAVEVSELPRHFVAVWNPSYSADPMDAHLAVLLSGIREHRENGSPESEVYVWWGKLRSRNRVQDLPHIGVIAEIAEELVHSDGQDERQLYLTDYRSLYVGQVIQLTTEDVRGADSSRVSDYMKKKQAPTQPLAKGESTPYVFDADCWFKLADIRRLVLDDTVAVVRELAQLQNTSYHNRPVSLYGGMVDLPLIVVREDHRTFFASEERDHISGRMWWAELDAERGRGIAEIERDLRDNVLGEDAWVVFEPSARAFLADAERLFRQHRRDGAFDYSGVILNFAKAIEVHIGWLIRGAVASSPEMNRVVSLHDKDRDLLHDEMPTLGQIAYLIKNDQAFKEIIRRLTGGEWLIREFVKTLGKLNPVRNDAAHDQRIDLATATEWRNSLLGVGCPGLLEQLAKVRPARQKGGDIRC